MALYFTLHWKKYVKQIGAPFLVVTKLHHVRSTGSVIKVFALYIQCQFANKIREKEMGF